MVDLDYCVDSLVDEGYVVIGPDEEVFIKKIQGEWIGVVLRNGYDISYLNDVRFVADLAFKAGVVDWFYISGVSE